jgi:hypothetical protein
METIICLACLAIGYVLGYAVGYIVEELFD